jgi:threonine dehydrogenase-like Zn-dependent dehydrogenase
MKALTIAPSVAGSMALEDWPEPPRADGALCVQTLAIGICGTDLDLVHGQYGWAPPGRQRLVIGHESLGRVVDAPPDSHVQPGDLIAGIVRRPDPVPCRFCAAGEWDMCRNGRYTERGIKERDGYASERFRLEPEFAVKVDPALGHLGVLLEPASIVAKAWDHAERIGRRSAAWRPRTALVTGAGPIGLLAALMGRQRGLDVMVFDRVTDGAKPQLAQDLGARYYGGALPPDEEMEPDVIIECTGATPVIADVLTRSAAAGIVCLAGISSGGHTIDLDIGDVNRQMVLENDAVFGSVNANRTHYDMAAAALAAADPHWLSRLISRRVPLARWHEAFERQPDDIKVVIDFQGPPRTKAQGPPKDQDPRTA